MRVLPGCVCTGTGGCCSHSPWLPAPSPSSPSPRPFCPPPSPVLTLSSDIFVVQSGGSWQSGLCFSPQPCLSRLNADVPPVPRPLHTAPSWEPRPAFRVTLSSSPSLVSEPSFSQRNLHLLEATRHVWSFLQVPREFQGSVRLDQGLERRQDVVLCMCVSQSLPSNGEWLDG